MRHIQQVQHEADTAALKLQGYLAAAKAQAPTTGTFNHPNPNNPNPNPGLGVEATTEMEARRHAAQVVRLEKLALQTKRDANAEAVLQKQVWGGGSED